MSERDVGGSGDSCAALSGSFKKGEERIASSPKLNIYLPSLTRPRPPSSAELYLKTETIGTKGFIFTHQYGSLWRSLGAWISKHEDAQR